MSSSSRTGGRTCTHPGVDEEGPREPVRRHWKMAIGKISAFKLPSCAASFACSSFSWHLKVNLGDQAFVGRGFRRWKMTRATTNT